MPIEQPSAAPMYTPSSTFSTGSPASPRSAAISIASAVREMSVVCEKCQVAS
jgi:hypothetical protein